MNDTTARRTERCDLLIVGSGAAGLTAAITASVKGLKVIIAEKAGTFGGTSALSGGMLWVPGNPVAERAGMKDDLDKARLYLRNELGNFYNAALVDAFLENGPEMVDFLERNSAMEFIAPSFPDYHPDVPGAVVEGRSIRAVPFDGRVLKENFKNLRMPIPEMMLWGKISIAPEDMRHVFRAAHSLSSFFHLARIAARGLADLATSHRGNRLTSGNAMIARLAKTVFDLGIPLWLHASVERLLLSEGNVMGARISTDSGIVNVQARCGVILAAGGFSANEAMRRAHFVHAAKGHISLVPADIQGDGISLGIDGGGILNENMAHPGTYVPISLVPRKDGSKTPFPHLLDRAKPGFIAINSRGERFANESASYHDFVHEMVATSRDEPEVRVHLIADHRAVRRYGLGAAAPAPMPLAPWLKSGYIARASTLDELASRIGVDARQLKRTVATFNASARNGEDPAFGKGRTLYNRFMGDISHKPNPCLAPLETGPYYAVRIYPGDLATMIGLKTDANACVLDGDGAPIPGLYAAGNDMASVMGGFYPGGGVTLGPGMTFGFIAASHAAEAHSAATSRKAPLS